MSKALKSDGPLEYWLVTLNHSIPTRRGVTTFTFNSGPITAKDGGFRITRDAVGYVIIEDTVGEEVIEVSPANVKELRRKKPKAEETTP